VDVEGPKLVDLSAGCEGGQLRLAGLGGLEIFAVLLVHVVDHFEGSLSERNCSVAHEADS
jgi:hypothetical protein